MTIGSPVSSESPNSTSVEISGTNTSLSQITMPQENEGPNNAEPSASRSTVAPVPGQVSGSNVHPNIAHGNSTDSLDVEQKLIVHSK